MTYTLKEEWDHLQDMKKLRTEYFVLFEKRRQKIPLRKISKKRMKEIKKIFKEEKTILL